MRFAASGKEDDFVLEQFPTFLHSCAMYQREQTLMVLMPYASMKQQKKREQGKCFCVFPTVTSGSTLP